MKNNSRKLTAILCADTKGFRRMTGREEAGALATLEGHRQVIGSLVEKRHGRVVSFPGGTLLAEFASAVDAVQCAMEIQKELKTRNEALPEEGRIPFRIGIHLGEVTEEEGTLRGDGIDVAVRIEGLADAGDTCISGSVHDQVKGKLSAEYEYLGEHRVQNMAEPVRAYRIMMEPGKAGRVAGRTGLMSYLETRLDIVKVVVTALSVLVGIGALWNSYFRAGPSPIGRASVERMALPLPDMPAIAVLPFENMTGDPKQEYFTDGFTEQIITSLSKISSLFVISRNSTFTYKGKPVKVQQVSEELGVRYVLEGSVQKFSSRIRINVQLIDAISGQHVWAQSYDRDLKDIFGLQDEVILKITSALSVNLTAGEQARAWAEGTKSLEAYLKLMQGREYRYKGNRESTALARRMAEEAIALDPKYAEAYVLLGWTHYTEVFLGTNRPEDAIPKATEFMQKALALNGSLAEAERGVELDPNSGQAYYNLTVILRWAGRSKEAIPVIQKALRLEPIPPDNYVQQMAMAYFLAGDCKEAIATCEKGLKRHPDHLVSRVIMATVYGSCGREAEARKEASEVLRINPKFSVETFTRNTPYKNPSDRDRVVQGLRKAGLP